jgi:BirA family biotin operon repressor/biotin-[acetyl-CoA-carboxylase] ligase
VADAYRYDGWAEGELALHLGVPRVALFERIGSTLDAAHALAASGAPAGTLVLAEQQTEGRGRGGKRWSSAPGAGIWLTLVERPADAEALSVLALRLGLRAAAVLDRFTSDRVQLKWPNDLHVGGRKLAGILVESRWRDGRPDWVAIGMGINVLPPAGEPGAAALSSGGARVEVLGELLPALRAAAQARGALSPAELSAFAARDLARGRRCTEPGAGTVRGLTPSGELVVHTGAGDVTFRAGSLVLAEDA